MKQPPQISPIITHIILIVIGLVLGFLGVYDIAFPSEENMFNTGGPDQTSAFYVVIGLLMIFAGFLGIRKANQDRFRKRY